MVGSGQALATWRQPHLGYPTVPVGSSSTYQAMAQRYGISGIADSSSKRASVPTTWEDVVVELERVSPFLKEVQEASQADAFDWNLDYSQGFGLLLPHLSP
jgi:hypothetical protein